MVIDDKTLKSFLKTNSLDSSDVLLVIERYIFDRKGVTVKINEPKGKVSIAGFKPVYDFHLMDEAYNNALKYYSDKFNNNFE